MEPQPGKPRCMSIIPVPTIKPVAVVHGASVRGPIIALLAATAGRSAAGLAVDHLAGVAAAKVGLEVRTRLLTACLERGPVWLGRHRLGTVTALATRGTAAVEPYLTRYLEQYRTLFPCAETDDHLWLSSKGGGLGAEAIYSLVCQRTEQGLGLAISPHLFRDIAARRPGNISRVKRRIRHLDLLAAQRRARAIMDQMDEGRIASLLDDFNTLAGPK